MRTKHGLIDFEDVYVEPNVWRQLGLTGRSGMSRLKAAMRRSAVVVIPRNCMRFWGIDVTYGELSPFRQTQAQAVGRVKKKTQLPRASRSVIINSAFSVRSGHFLCKN